MFEGKTSLKDFYRIIKIEDESIFENKKGESETIAGFVLEISKSFPKLKTQYKFNNYTFIVEGINNKRIKLSDKLYKKRAELKKIVMNKKISLEERFKAQQKLSKLPRNSAKIRVMNRCQITGRPHGVYRKLKISRIALRQLGLQGKIPGLVKSSW